MSTRSTRFVAANYILLVRSCVVIIGSIAVSWGLIEFPIFWRDSSAERVAGQIISGDQFTTQTLTQQLSILSSTQNSNYCSPIALRSAAIIQLRMTEVSTPSDDYGDKQLTSLRDVIRSSLSCAPADPFLWLALYWVASMTNPLGQDDLQYLRMSYELGPNEGWIAIKRNYVAFKTFQRLPRDLAEATIKEFILLVENNFFAAAADIFIGPASPERGLILSHLEELTGEQRRSFADALSKRGYDSDMLDKVR